MSTGLAIVRHHQLERLFDALATRIEEAPGQVPLDPMQPLRIVVGNHGMGRWLTLRCAERWGIAANLVCPFPEQALQEAMRTLAAASLSPASERVTRASTAASAPGRVYAPADRTSVLEAIAHSAADAWAPSSLVWTVLAVLAALADRIALDPTAPASTSAPADPVFARLWTYLQRVTGPDVRAGLGSAHGVALASAIAEGFDRIITWRASLARAWTEAPPPDGHDDWLQALWWQLVERLGPTHAAQRLEALRGLSPTPRAFEQPLRVFGLSALPPGYLDRLALLCPHVGVELYLLSPSERAWSDLHAQRGHAAKWLAMPRERAEDRLLAACPVEHPLLASLGRTLRHFQVRLEALPKTHGVRFTDHAPATWAEADADAPLSALERLQRDIREARLPEAPRALAERDTSLCLHACAGPTRQVEALRDALGAAFAADATLEPRDVVVLCPAIESFAPLITAVFDAGARHLGADGWGPSGLPRLPYRVVDQSQRRQNPVADVLLRVLALASARLTAPALVDLCELAPVRERFGFGREDGTAIRAWVHASGFRWAADAEDRARFGQPADAQNTLAFGLDRLLAAIAWPPEVLAHEIAPVAGAFGRDHQLALGGFAELAATVATARREASAARPLRSWIDWLLGAEGEPGLLDRMTATRAEDAWQAERVRATLRELRAASAALDLALDVGAFASVLEGRFGLPAPAGAGASGGISFGALVPMRGQPHRIVVLLGMDEGAFPRARGGQAFDRVAAAPELGDPSPPDEDRGAFLEAILAAREKLWVFYSGSDPRTCEALPPCAPVAELADAIDLSFEAPALAREGALAAGRDAPSASAWLTVEHPLQAFGVDNFRGRGGRAPRRVGDDAPRSFDRRLLQAATRAQADASRAAAAERAQSAFFAPGTVLPEPAAVHAPGGEVGAPTIDLDDLAAFLRDPLGQLLRRRLRLWPAAEELALADREPLELEGKPWEVVEPMALALAGGASAEVAEARMAAEGRLPLGFAGGRALARAGDLARELAAIYRQLSPREDFIDIDLRVGPAVLRGRVGGLAGAIDLYVRHWPDDPGKAPTWMIRPWVRLLARLAAGHGDARVEGQHVFYDKKKDAVVRQRRTLASPADPLGLLARIVDLYRDGLVAPLPLLPRGSFALAHEVAKALTLDALDARDPLAALPREVRRRAADKVRAAWGPPNRFARTDAEDDAVARLYGDTSPAFEGDPQGGQLAPAFVRASLGLWLPILAARVVSRNPKIPGGGA